MPPATHGNHLQNLFHYAVFFPVVELIGALALALILWYGGLGILAGDTLHFTVSAMGQVIGSKVTVFEDNVHAIVDLPGLLGLFAGKVQDMIRKEGPKLLR